MRKTVVQPSKMFNTRHQISFQIAVSQLQQAQRIFESSEVKSTKPDQRVCVNPPAKIPQPTTATLTLST